MQPKLIRIDGVIGTAEGEISSTVVRSQLPPNGTDPIDVRLHSEGGSVFEGFAIHDLLAEYKGPKTLSIESSAFSIASFIATAFDDVQISSNGYMMLHNPYAKVEGDDEEMLHQASLLAQLKTDMVAGYAKKSGLTNDDVRNIMKRETYLNAAQCVSMGFASRISGTPVIGRTFSTTANLPHGVVAALFGAGSCGENRDSEEIEMSEPQPVAATLQEIEAAFPRARAEFVVKCLRSNLPMASVATAAVEELMSENASLVAQVQSLQEELAKATAAVGTTAMEDSSGAEPDKTSEDDSAEEDTDTTARAQRSGARPVAKARTSVAFASATARWRQGIAERVKAGQTRAQASLSLDREQPELRAAMLAEANAR